VAGRQKKKNNSITIPLTYTQDLAISAKFELKNSEIIVVILVPHLCSSPLRYEEQFKTKNDRSDCEVNQQSGTHNGSDILQKPELIFFKNVQESLSYVFKKLCCSTHSRIFSRHFLSSILVPIFPKSNDKIVRFNILNCTEMSTTMAHTNMSKEPTAKADTANTRLLKIMKITRGMLLGV
jgi:hypothetical protein